MRDVTVVTVFSAGPGGGNPAPIVVDAAGMSDEEMAAVAQRYGFESGFVLPGDGDHDVELRFWVPAHEVEMCGHATLGAVWLLDRLGRLPGDRVRVGTRAGTVHARVDDRDGGGGRRVEISQPPGRVEALAGPDADAVLDVLGLGPGDLADRPLLNAATSRVKTLVPVRDATTLDAVRPDHDRMEAVCGRVGSTGLYPYAVVDLDRLLVDARQFPRSSGYPEDAATGIAAAALAFGLLELGLVEASAVAVTVRQGRAMGRPSEITVRFAREDAVVRGCWLTGRVE